MKAIGDRPGFRLWLTGSRPEHTCVDALPEEVAELVTSLRD
jgi:hypothetical protein